MAQKQKEKQQIVKQKRNENEELTMKIKEDEQFIQQEKEQIKGKRLSYRQLLDQQLVDNARFKQLSAMNKNELELNKSDLDMFLKGEYTL